MAANALAWRFLDFIAVKVVFLIRLLVLARLLAPEDFGLLAIGLTAVTGLMTLSDFGIEAALIQRTHVRQQDYDAGWTIGVVRTTLVVSLILLAAPWIAELFGDVRATPIIRVLAICVIIDALASVRLASLNRELRFRSLAIVHLAEATATTVVAIVMASSFGVWALICGALAGSLANTVFSYIVAPYRPRLRWHHSSVSGLLSFGRWMFLTGIVVMVANAGLRLIISRYLGVAELGIFYLAGRLAFLPYYATVDVIESVTFPLYSRLRHEAEKARELYRTAMLGTATLLIPSCLILAAVAPGLIEHILGEHWAGTTYAIQILALSSPLGLLGYAATPLLKGFGLPSRITLFQVIHSGLNLLLVWILTIHFALLGTVTAVLLAVVLSQPLAVAITSGLLNHPYARLLRPLLAITMASLAGALVAGWLDLNLPGVTGFMVACIAGLVTTLILIYTADRLLKLDLVNVVTRHFPVLSHFLFAKNDGTSNVTVNNINE